MMPPSRSLSSASLVILLVLGMQFGLQRIHANQNPVNTEAKMKEIRDRVLPALRKAATEKGVTVGQPIFFRIFKEEKQLELWMRPKAGGQWNLFRTWSISTWGSGGLGPKLKEGDGQAAEGFYKVGKAQMNPNSSYHLSFNVGYPNAFDKAHGRTGSLIMVHGREVSIGWGRSHPQVAPGGRRQNK